MLTALQNINRLQVIALISLFGAIVLYFYKPHFHGMTLLDMRKKMRSYKYVNIKVCKIFCRVSRKYHLAIRAENFFELQTDAVTSYLYIYSVEFFTDCSCYRIVVVVIVIIRKVYC